MICRDLITKLAAENALSRREWVFLWSNYSPEDRAYAASAAGRIAEKIFGRNVFIRGIVEFSNFCKNDCFYCGIRRSNSQVVRYNLSDEIILECCQSGWKNGICTFVLQSGEAAEFDLERMCALVRKIKAQFAGCAVTLSLGELSFEEYAALRNAGADRYLLRHESADPVHYRKLHPVSMKLENRLQCLKHLHQLGFQTGCGVMLGSPFQSAESLAEDMVFMQEFKPEMIGVGPFIPHRDTPFGKFASGTLDSTLFMISLCRLMHPQVLLPATTALGTLQANGRVLGISSGANVIMPNLTPRAVQENYNLYDNKKHTDRAIGEAVSLLQQELSCINYSLKAGRGDFGG